MPHTTRPAIRKRIDQRLTPREALLGPPDETPLPTQRWKRVSSGEARAAGIIAELGLDARRHARRPASAVRAGLHLLADQIADAIEAELPRVA